MPGRKWKRGTKHQVGSWDPDTQEWFPRRGYPSKYERALNLYEIQMRRYRLRMKDWEAGEMVRKPRHPRHPEELVMHESTARAMAYAELYDYGYPVERIVAVFDVKNVGTILSSICRYSHRPLNPARFMRVCSEGIPLSISVASILRGEEIFPQEIHWGGCCSKCNSVLADGVCVLCQAQFEQVRSSQGGNHAYAV